MRRFNDHWKNSIQHLVFLVALMEWLQTEKLVSPADVEAQLSGMRSSPPSRTDSFPQCRALRIPTTLAWSSRTI